MRVFMCAAALAAMLSSQALAAFDLRITEIWPGNEPGENLSDDWFEITNYGNMSWTAASDGDLYYDDDAHDGTSDSTTADLMSGIATIAPGESVIFVDGSATTGGVNTFLWSQLWSPVVNPLPQVGTFEGSGLGGGGDGVAIWITASAPSGSPDITGVYPNADANGGQSYDLALGSFSTVGNLSGAVATIELNDESQPAIASPGSVGVPEPASLALVGMGLVLLAAKRP